MWLLQAFSFLIFIISIQTFQVYYGPPKEATLSERPFQVAIIKNDAYKCSAAIVSKKCVITACSCIVGEDINLDGKSKLADNYTLVTYTRYIQVKQLHWEFPSDVFIAEGCNTDTNENDAAILCARNDLAGFPVNVVKEQTKENVRGIVSGWGLSVEGQVPIQNHLQRAYMRIISLEECRRLYAGVREVPDSALCAVAIDQVRGFCGGDIGGPLTHGEGLIGIAASSFGCEEKKYPGIFTNVSRISKFIENSIEEHHNQVEIHLLK